jgi:predicted phage terminase large subunit-like protein
MSVKAESEFEAEQIEPFREQIPFIYDRSKRYYGFVSGSGAGKTVGGVARTELNAVEWNEGAMGAIIAPTGRMIKNNIIPLMRRFGYLSEWEYKSSHSDEPGIHISGPEGGRILLLSASDERTIEYLNGLNLAYVWMDEHRDIPARATEIAVQRLRAGDYRNLYITTTPRGKNHTYDFFIGNQKVEREGWGEATLYKSDDRLCVGGVPSHANPYTPQDYKDSLKSDLPEEIRAQEVQGEFVEIGSGVFKRDMLHFCASDAISPDWNLNYILGVDPATQADATKAREQDSDYWAATLAAVHRRSQQIFVLDTKRQRGMSLKQGVSWLAEIAGQVPSPKLYVESNQAQDWLRQSLADEGLNATPVNSSRNKEERLIDLSIPLEQGTVKFVNHEINGQLGYDPRWQNLIQEMLAFPEGSHDDLLDSLGLTVRNASIGTQSILSANMYGDRDE